ncbi:hypothetical protein DUNSADRAFT_16521 [Dunaliella salina]|nr:hypothetical protein DUNSADRAFT_16521 [Dunaliella salina]|eukprot:KAF5829120.1 hypothetical protein DUNSADRAFT_16521 [Dunaliella salina]
MIGHGGPKHRQQEHLLTSPPAGKLSALEGNTQGAGHLPPHQPSVPPAINGDARVAHAGRGGSGQESLEGSSQNQQQQQQERQTQQQQQEKQKQAVQGLTSSVLEDCDTVDAWRETEGGKARETAAAAAAAAAGHSTFMAPRTEVSGAGRHAGADEHQPVCEGAGAVCVAPPAPAVDDQHAQQQGQVLMGLAADSVLRVGVTNHSSTACFEVQLSYVASEQGWQGEVGEGSNVSKGSAAVGDGFCLQGGSWLGGRLSGQDSREVDQENRCSPPVALQPGESTSLLAYLCSTAPADPNNTRGPQAAGHSVGLATTSNKESLHRHCRSDGAVIGAAFNSRPVAHDSTSSVACTWETSGGCAEVAAAAAAAGWVVVWRHVDAPRAGGTVTAAAAATDGAPAAAAVAQGAVRDAPRGVCWLTAADLAKNMTAPAAVALHPPPLHFGLHAVSYPSHPCTEPPSPSLSSGCDVTCCGVHPRLHDVSRPLAKVGALGSHSRLGQLWAVGTGLGEILEVRVGLSTAAPSASPPAPPPASGTRLPVPEVDEGLRGRLQGWPHESLTVGLSEMEVGCHPWQHSPPLHVCFDVAITRVVPDEARDDALVGHAEECHSDNSGTGVGAVEDGAEGDSKWCGSKLGGGGASEEGRVLKSSSGGSSIDEGVVLVSGATHNVHVGLLPGRTHRQPLLLSFTRPGLYQVHVTNVAAAPLQLPLPHPSSSSPSPRQVRDSPEHGDGPGREVAQVRKDGLDHQDGPGQRDPSQQPPAQQRDVAGYQMGSACYEGDNGALEMAVAASVLRGSVMGRGTLAPTPARVDALNVLALAPAPIEDSHGA